MTAQAKEIPEGKEGKQESAAGKRGDVKTSQAIKQEKTKKQEAEKALPKGATQETPARKDPWAVLLYPHLGEKSMGMVEFQNRLTFIVNKKATKQDIAQAMEEAFQIQVKHVRVEMTRKGVKKAYITLTPKHSAADIATRLGMI